LVISGGIDREQTLVNHMGEFLSLFCREVIPSRLRDKKVNLLTSRLKSNQFS
jgi:hypothetical protein